MRVYLVLYAVRSLRTDDPASRAAASISCAMSALAEAECELSAAEATFARAGRALALAAEAGQVRASRAAARATAAADGAAAAGARARGLADVALGPEDARWRSVATMVGGAQDDELLEVLREAQQVCEDVVAGGDEDRVRDRVEDMLRSVDAVIERCDREEREAEEGESGAE